MILPARFHDPTVFGSLADARRLETGSQLCCHQTRSSIAVTVSGQRYNACLVPRPSFLVPHRLRWAP